MPSRKFMRVISVTCSFIHLLLGTINTYWAPRYLAGLGHCDPGAGWGGTFRAALPAFHPPLPGLLPPPLPSQSPPYTLLNCLHKKTHSLFAQYTFTIDSLFNPEPKSPATKMLVPLSSSAFQHFHRGRNRCTLQPSFQFAWLFPLRTDRKLLEGPIGLVMEWIA